MTDKEFMWVLLSLAVAWDVVVGWVAIVWVKRALGREKGGG